VAAGASTGGSPQDPPIVAQHLCRTVIGIRVGEALFGGCVSSLSETIVKVRHSQAEAAARLACFAHSVAPGSAERSLCLLGAADGGAPASFAANLADAKPGDRDNPVGFSNDNATSREREACAHLGLDPAFNAFAGCVANLQDSLQQSSLFDD
jgi:hypothetical protein